MWKNIEIANVVKIEKNVGEFIIWMVEILPYATMKIKIYEENTGRFYGISNVRILEKKSASFQTIKGFGNTLEEALESTLEFFQKSLEENEYAQLTETDVQYIDWYDF